MTEQTNAQNPNESDAAAVAASAAAPGAAQVAGGEGDEGGDATILGGASETDKAADPGTGQEGAATEGEGAEGGDESAAAGAPERYELKAPEGATFDTEAFEAAEPVLRELGLSNEQAQKLVDAYAKDIVPKIFERANENLNQLAADRRKEWSDAFEADPDLGGANKDKTLAAAARAFDHYGLKPGEGLRLMLNESGLGNHPDMIRFVARVGHDLGEGAFERGSAATAPKNAEGALYGPEFQPKT